MPTPTKKSTIVKKKPAVKSVKKTLSKKPVKSSLKKKVVKKKSRLID